MTIKALNQEGEEIEVYTPEEVEAMRGEYDTKLTEAEQKAKEAAEHLGKKTDEFIRAKQGFKKYSEMTEEEKAKLSAEQQSTMQQLEEIRTSQEQERLLAKEAMLKAVARGDEAVLEKLKEKYDMVNMSEKSVAEIQNRINSVIPWAYAELGIVEKQPISIETTFASSGAVPRVQGEEEKRFSETEKGKDVTQAIFGNVLPKDNK